MRRFNAWRLNVMMGRDTPRDDPHEYKLLFFAGQFIIDQATTGQIYSRVFTVTVSNIQGSSTSRRTHVCLPPFSCKKHNPLFISEGAATSPQEVSP